jgi:hypothetical protein
MMIHTIPIQRRRRRRRRRVADWCLRPPLTTNKQTTKTDSGLFVSTTVSVSTDRRTQVSGPRRSTCRSRAFSVSPAVMDARVVDCQQRPPQVTTSLVFVYLLRGVTRQAWHNNNRHTKVVMSTTTGHFGRTKHDINDDDDGAESSFR